LIITIIYKLQPFFVNSSLYWRLSERGFLISNDKARSGMYIEALKFFYDNPLFGIGFNHYRLLSIYQSYSHSTYAEILSTTGLIGSIIYFIPYLIIIYNLYSIYKKQKATVASLKSIQFLVLMFVMLVLGTGVIHFYNIRDNIMFALMISFYYIEELKLKQHTYIINSK